MKTGYGQECRYYYRDYFRGHETEECRLIGANPQSTRWSPGLCQTCHVPGILLTNACPNLLMVGRVEKGLFGLTQKVNVRAACHKYAVEVGEPQIGCGYCAEEARRRLQELADQEKRSRGE